jgi:hypothetical protein
MRKLAALIKDMSEDEKRTYVSQMPITTCEGHELSLYNKCLSIMQARAAGITVSVLGGFRQWHKVNRTVRKGMHACCSIAVPIYRPGAKELGDEKLAYFKYVPMFDLSQTEVDSNSVMAEFAHTAVSPEEE